MLVLPIFLALLQSNFIEVPFTDIILFHTTELDSKSFHLRQSQLEKNVYHRSLATINLTDYKLQNWTERYFPLPVLFSIEVAIDYFNGNGGNNSSTTTTGPYHSLLDSFVPSPLIKSEGQDSPVVRLPWIIFIYCPSLPSNDQDQNQIVDIEIELLVEFARANVPFTKYQLNSNVYFVTCFPEVFEIYFIRARLFLKKIFSRGDDFIKSPFFDSATFRRTNFGEEPIIVGLAKTYNYTSNRVSGKHVEPEMVTPTFGLWEYMERFLNITTIFQNNHGWPEMQDNMESGLNDVGLSATGMILSVVAKARFLNIPTYTDQTKAYFSQTKPTITMFLEHVSITSPYVVFEHLRPLRKEAWIGIGITSLILAVSHFVMTRQGFSKTLLWVTSNLTLRGLRCERRNSIRTITVVGSLMGIFLNALYSGELISSLSNKGEPVYTLNKLISDGFTFGFINDSYLEAAREAGDYEAGTTAHKVFANLHPKFGETDIETGILNVISRDKFAFITEESFYEYLQNSAKNDTRFAEAIDLRVKKGQPLCTFLRDAPIPEYTVQQSPITRPDSPFVNHFNYARLRSHETGIWRHVQKRRANRIAVLKPICVSRTVKSFDIRDVLLPLFTMFVGMLICSCCFLLELTRFLINQIAKKLVGIENF